MKYELYHEFNGNQRAVRAVRFNNDGNYCVSCGSDKSVKLWNPHRKLLLQTYMAHGYEALDAATSCDNSQLTSCGADKQVILWDVATAKTLKKYRAHAGKVNCVRFNEESSVIISGSIDCTVRLWDCRSRSLEAIQTLEEGRDSIMSVTVSDHEIMTGSLDCHIRRYDIRAGKLFTDCIGSSVCSVTDSGDGQCLLTSSLDSTVRLMDKDTGQMLNEYKGHKNKEYKIDNCFNDKDTLVFSGSENGNVYCWNLLEGKVVDVLSVSERTVPTLSHHPSEACLLAASQNVIYMYSTTTPPPPDENDTSNNT